MNDHVIVGFLFVIAGLTGAFISCYALSVVLLSLRYR